MRLKEFSVEDESFGKDSTQRLLTASQLIGLPRRDPIKSKVVPNMKGVLGGDSKGEKLLAIETALNQTI